MPCAPMLPRTEPLPGVGFGARVADASLLDTARAADGPANIRALLREHGGLLVWPAQHLEPRQMAQVMATLGSLRRAQASRSAKCVEGVPDAPTMSIEGLP